MMNLFITIYFGLMALLFYRLRRTVENATGLLEHIHHETVSSGDYEKALHQLKFFDQVSFERRVFTFWKPVKSFYKEWEDKHPFIREHIQNTYENCL